MIVRDMFPVSVVSGEGFNDFVESLNSGFVVPHRTTMARRIALVYDSCKEKVLLFEITFWLGAHDAFESRAHCNFNGHVDISWT